MTDEEIEAYRKRLNDLTAHCSDQNPEQRISEDLKQLARTVGSSTRVLWVSPTTGGHTTGDADTSVIIQNIHQALQTASMVNMCKTATGGYEIATKVSRSARIQFWIATGIAFICAVAAWVAAIRN